MKWEGIIGMFFVSLSVRLFFCLSVCLYVCNIRVRVITYLNIDVLLYNVIQLCHIIMCSDLDPGIYLKG